jgi:hypothetical protein
LGHYHFGHFQNAVNQGWGPENLVKRAEANPGIIIPFADPENSEKTGEKEESVKVLPKPENVAILMDDAIVSAGEAFVIKIMKFKKLNYLENIRQA